jgi:hypothetical protein
MKAVLPVVAILLVMSSSVAQIPKAQPVRSADDEVRAVAQRFWDSVFTKCGDSYYYKDFSTGIQQYRGLSFDVTGSRPLTAADQLNGVQWNGLAIAAAKSIRYFAEGYASDRTAPSWSLWMDGSSVADAKRLFSVDNKFSDWHPHIPSDKFAGASVEMTKRNGNWSFYPQAAGNKKISCEAIPAQSR